MGGFKVFPFVMEVLNKNPNVWCTPEKIVREGRAARSQGAADPSEYRARGRLTVERVNNSLSHAFRYGNITEAEVEVDRTRGHRRYRALVSAPTNHHPPTNTGPQSVRSVVVVGTLTTGEILIRYMNKVYKLVEV